MLPSLYSSLPPVKDSVFVHEFSALLQLCEEYSVSVSSLSRYSRDIISTTVHRKRDLWIIVNRIEISKVEI